MTNSKRVSRTRPEEPRRDIWAKTTVIKVQRADDSTSRQIDLDTEWGLDRFSGLTVPVPYSVGDLTRVISQSSTLRPCIEAYTVNTVQTGWEVEATVRGTDGKDSEIMELQSFVDNANSDESLSAVMNKVIDDRESLGYGFLEGIRDVMQRISLLRHCPAHYTRLCPKHDTEVLVEYTIMRGRRTVTVKEFRKFRRYVQMIAAKMVYFKEWGDPRKLDRVTGKFEGEDGYVAGREATELLHFRLPSNEPYGVPRWVIQMPSIIGSREAEEVNMRYFKDNTVPPMMLTVSGGRLTAHSYQELTNALHNQDIGSNRQNRIMIVEATGDADTLDGKGTPVSLKVEKMTDARQSDSLFDGYDTKSQEKVRMSWRLPGVVLGQGTDTNYANAQVAIFTADSQVFGPARVEVEEILNKKVVASERGLGIRSVRLISRVPAISSPETTVKTLTALNVMGAVTPRDAQRTANKVLQMELREYPKKGEEGYEAWMDAPISLSTASKTHANQALKTPGIKETEETGDPGFQRPENGREAETLQ